MGIQYEWCAEEVDEYGDVIELHFAKTRAEAEMQKPRGNGVTTAICLVRDAFLADGQLTDRQYAYVKPDGTMPTEFDAGALVPKRFIQVQ